jgi:hypothetical protein
MITMWIFLVLGWVIVFGQMTNHSNGPQTTSSPQVAAQPAPSVILPPTAAQAPLPAPLPTLPPVDQPEPVTGPLTTFGDGTYIVGTDILPGTYKSDGQSGYWARLKNTEGGLDSIITNKYSSGGPQTVTIKKTDKAFETSGMTWTLTKRAA